MSTKPKTKTKPARSKSEDSDKFIPDEAISGGDGKFLNIKDEETNVVRIISKPVMGWLNWEEDEEENKVPKRYPIDEEPETTDEDNKPRKFIAVVVVNRNQDDKIQVCEITQQSIIKAINALADNPKWGNPFAYDLNIERKGEGKKSRYTVTPSPKEALPKSVVKEIADTEVYLANYFDGDDSKSPWEKEDNAATKLYAK